jgi:hypothetical protein
MNTQQIVDTYGASWNETDVAKRSQLLEQAWGNDGVYTDPQSHAEGRDALVELIGGFQAQYAGAKIVATSAVDAPREVSLHRPCRPPTAPTAMEGIDFAAAPDGRIQRIALRAATRCAVGAGLDPARTPSGSKDRPTCSAIRSGEERRLRSRQLNRSSLPE